MNAHTPQHFEKSEGSSDRSFGLVFFAFFLIVAVLPLIHGNAVRLWAIGLSMTFGIFALIFPHVLAPLNRRWTKFGLFLHAVVSPIVLGILFFFVVTPTALLMRLFGKDTLQLRLDKGAMTYWISRKPPGPEPESLKNQF